MLRALWRGPLDGTDDLDVAIPLSDVVHQEFESFGTDGIVRTENDGASALLFALWAVLARIGIEFEVPWRDFTTFRTYWIAEGCSGHWQVRRDLLEKHFEPVHRELLRLEDHSFAGGVAQPVTPARGTGWPRVDGEVRELRRRFASASTSQDYRALGIHCVGVLEALSRTVYDPAVHLRDGETVPPIDKSKVRIGRFVEHSLAGGANAEVRGLVNKAVELAHAINTPRHRADATQVSQLTPSSCSRTYFGASPPSASQVRGTFHV